MKPMPCAVYDDIIGDEFWKKYPHLMEEKTKPTSRR
jgi:hypothetical protein